MSGLDIIVQYKLYRVGNVLLYYIIHTEMTQDFVCLHVDTGMHSICLHI